MIQAAASLVALVTAMPVLQSVPGTALPCTEPGPTITYSTVPQSSADHTIASHARYLRPSIAARSQMLEALSPAHRKLFASAIAGLSTSPSPDAATAMDRFDVVLTSDERRAIVAAQDLYDKDVSGDPSYPSPSASAAVLLLGGTLYGPGGVLLFSDSYLLHSSGYTATSQASQNGCPEPSPSGAGESGETLEQSAAKLEALRTSLYHAKLEERRRMLGALSAAHRIQFGSIFGNMAVAPELDTPAAGRLIDAMLSPAERDAVLAVARASATDDARIQYAQSQEMLTEAALRAAASGAAPRSPSDPPQHIQIQIPTDPAAVMLTTSLGSSFSLHSRR